MALALGRGVFLTAWLLVTSALAAPVTVQPRPLLLGRQLMQWEFESGSPWQPGSLAKTATNQGILRVISLGEDPNISSPPLTLQGPLVVSLRVRAAAAGSGELFWLTTRSPDWSPRQSRGFRLRHDGQWHEYRVLIDTDQTVTQLRLDPGSAPGEIGVDWIRISSGRLHPLDVRAIRRHAGGLTVRILNDDVHPVKAHVNGQSVQLEAGKETDVEVAIADATAPFAVVPVVIRSAGLPEIRLPVCVSRPEAKVEWLRRDAGALTMEVVPDGSGARFLLAGRMVAEAAPLVRLGERIPAMKCVDPSAETLTFRGEGVTLTLRLGEDGAKVGIEAVQAVEGPVFRATGALEQGLLAGVEHLGKQERSSSTLDIETDDHWRVRPDPLSVTMPLMACVTDQVAAALLWEMGEQPAAGSGQPAAGSRQQAAGGNGQGISTFPLPAAGCPLPIFASPNFLDGTDDHRMALEGKSIRAALYLKPPQPLEEVIAWAVRERGLPPLPPRPRTDEQQRALLLRGFTQSAAGEGGWGHAAEPRWERRPYADVASAIGRLRGDWPNPKKLVSGGAHIRNDAAYFLTGRATQWIGERAGEARALLAQQQPDGSFRYDGPYRRGHFEDTASGYNAARAVTLLEHARLTGDPASLEGGLRCLQFMKRFRTPRGAQTHELPLHAPDLLASAYLVWAYARGFELTGQAEYRDLARRWALSGVPFIYQWRDPSGRLPVLAYASIPTLAATQWVEPNWIGLPVQWCGLVYGYALTMLAPHDATLDWTQLARGILITAEQMQYPDGPLAGCLPDFYLLAEQRRGGPSVNPGALASLQLALQGQVDSLAVARSEKDPALRVTAPFPVTVHGDTARVQASPGIGYQVVVDGKRVVDVAVSMGVDEVPLGRDEKPAR